MGNFKPTRLDRHNPEPLSNALALFIKVNGLWPGLYRNAVFEAWDEVSGAAGYTTNKFLRDNVLYVTISSSVLRSQLSFNINAVKDALNEKVAGNSLLSRNGAVPPVLQIKLR